MGIKGKLEIEVDIKSSGDQFHQLFQGKPHEIPDLTPDKIHTFELLEGELGKPGSVMCWNYTHDGKKCVAKELVEAIDAENKLVKLKIIEGDPLNEFKSLTVSVQIIPKGEVNGVKWIADFEKIHDDGPYPTKLLDLCIGITKDIEARHLNQ